MDNGLGLAERLKYGNLSAEEKDVISKLLVQKATDAFGNAMIDVLDTVESNVQEHGKKWKADVGVVVQQLPEEDGAGLIANVECRVYLGDDE